MIPMLSIGEMAQLRLRNKFPAQASYLAPTRGRRRVWRAAGEAGGGCPRCRICTWGLCAHQASLRQRLHLPSPAARHEAAQNLYGALFTACITSVFPPVNTALEFSSRVHRSRFFAAGTVSASNWISSVIGA